jgi:hypothetical protein
MKAKIEIINIDNFLDDFKNMAVRSEIVKRDLLNKWGMILQSSMRRILIERVIKWTGKLSNSILVYNQPDETIIKPNTSYDMWIEVGGRHGFTGYHYVEETYEKYEKMITNELKQKLKL